MNSPGDREFPPSAWGAALLLIWTAGISALCVVLGLGTAVSLTWTGKFLATGTGFCVFVFALAAVSGGYAVQLLRAWKIPVLVIDAAGIHAPRKAQLVEWHKVEKVAIFNNDGELLLQLSPGNTTDRWWRRLSGSTDFDIGLAKDRHEDIIAAIQQHPRYRGV